MHIENKAVASSTTFYYLADHVTAKSMVHVYIHVHNKYTNNFLHPLQSLDAPSLQDISLNLNSNHLLAVIGPVGAGKVSYLLVISVFDSSWEL